MACEEITEERRRLIRKIGSLAGAEKLGEVLKEIREGGTIVGEEGRRCGQGNDGCN